jgi:hypothetical protein
MSFLRRTLAFILTISMFGAGIPVRVRAQSSGGNVPQFWQDVTQSTLDDQGPLGDPTPGTSLPPGLKTIDLQHVGSANSKADELPTVRQNQPHSCQQILSSPSHDPQKVKQLLKDCGHQLGRVYSEWDRYVQEYADALSQQAVPELTNATLSTSQGLHQKAFDLMVAAEGKFAGAAQAYDRAGDEFQVLYDYSTKILQAAARYGAVTKYGFVAAEDAVPTGGDSGLASPPESFAPANVSDDSGNSSESTPQTVQGVQQGSLEKVKDCQKNSQGAKKNCKSCCGGKMSTAKKLGIAALVAAALAAAIAIPLAVSSSKKKKKKDDQPVPPTTTSSACPSGKVWDTASSSCITGSSSPCPSGQTWDAGAAMCVAGGGPSSCASGTVWDAGSSMCVSSGGSSCPTGQAWNPSTSACVTLNSTNCNLLGSNFSWNPSSSQCEEEGLHLVSQNSGRHLVGEANAESGTTTTKGLKSTGSSPVDSLGASSEQSGDGETISGFPVLGRVDGDTLQPILMDRVCQASNKCVFVKRSLDCRQGRSKKHRVCAQLNAVLGSRIEKSKARTEAGRKILLDPRLGGSGPR